MQVAKHQLFHHGGSCLIETSPLICSANQWTGFCIIGTSFMKDSRRASSTYTKSLFLHVVKNIFLFLFLFFFVHLACLSRILTNHRATGEGGGYLLKPFLPIPPASQTLKH